MSSPEIPTEIAAKIVDYLDVPTRRTLGQVCPFWLCVSRHSDRFNPTFDDTTKIRAFLNLISSNSCTLPKPVRCESVCVNIPATPTQDTAPALSNLMASVVVEKTLIIHITAGGIPDNIAEILKSCTDIHQLTLVGGTLTFPAFIDLVGSFPDLRVLRLEAFALVQADGLGAVQNTLPSGLTRLCVVQSPSLWTFFRAKDFKFSGFQELHVAEQFTYQDEGVLDMLQFLRAMQGVPTLELEPLYEANSRYLDIDMKSIFQSTKLPLLKIRGLKNLRFKFARVPAHFSFDCLGIYTIFLPHTDLDLNVEIDVPQLPSLWHDSDPLAQLQQLIREANPPYATAVTGPATVTVRGFPGPLPSSMQATRTASVFGYPVSFVDCEGEEAT